MKLTFELSNFKRTPTCQIIIKHIFSVLVLHHHFDTRSIFASGGIHILHCPVYVMDTAVNDLTIPLGIQEHIYF